MVPYGVLQPPQRFAMRVQRYMHEHGVRQEAMQAMALAHIVMRRRTRAR